MSDTPRTDAMVGKGPANLFLLEHARTLERELTEANAQRAPVPRSEVIDRLTRELIEARHDFAVSEADYQGALKALREQRTYAGLTATLLQRVREDINGCGEVLGATMDQIDAALAQGYPGSGDPAAANAAAPEPPASGPPPTVKELQDRPTGFTLRELRYSEGYRDGLKAASGEPSGLSVDARDWLIGHCDDPSDPIGKTIEGQRAREVLEYLVRLEWERGNVLAIGNQPMRLCHHGYDQHELCPICNAPEARRA